MSIKTKLLQEINKKTQKIREKRVEAANNKTLEAAVFEFFRHIDESRGVTSVGYDQYLVNIAKDALEQRVRSFDSRGKVSIEYNVSEDLHSWDNDQQIRGVTIWWSQAYIKKNNVDPSLYIDISQMLLSSL